MPTTTPKQNRRRALRVLAVSGPLALVTLMAWGMHLVPDERQSVVFMVYQLLLATAGGAAIVAAVSHGQLGIARAFAAGYNTALRQLRERDKVDGSDLPPPLRLVE